MAILAYSDLGASLAVRSFVRIGATLSMVGACRAGSSMAVLAYSGLGASLAVRSFSRLGASLSM
eukprot:5340016-Amphidinium_carterae.1